MKVAEEGLMFIWPRIQYINKLFHPYLWDMDSVWLPVEVWRVIVHVSNLDVYRVFDHLREETPRLNSSKNHLHTSLDG